MFRVINGLSRLGADVVHKGNALVHVSGHAAAGELLYCYNIVRPRNVMPVHGEWRHLRAQRRHRACAPGSRASASCSPTTASWSTSSTAVATIVGAVPCGFVYVDGISRRRRHRDAR